MKQRGPILWKQTFNEVIMPNILLGKNLSEGNGKRYFPWPSTTRQSTGTMSLEIHHVEWYGGDRDIADMTAVFQKCKIW